MPETPDESPLDRPLPSVRMPILREDRRARRTRTIAIAVSVATMISAGACVLALGLQNEDDAQKPLAQEDNADEAASKADGQANEASPMSSPPKAPLATLKNPSASGSGSGSGSGSAGDNAAPEPANLPVPVPSPVQLQDGTHGAQIQTTFGQARSFREAIRNAGLDGDECAALEKALTDVMDFRRCRPSDRMLLQRNADGALVRFEYHSHPLEYIKMERNASGTMQARLVKRPVERRQIAVGGRVQTSLGEALSRSGLSTSLVGAYAEAFGANVNFATQARVGDTFRIIVDEERVNGEFLRYGTVHALEYIGQRAGTLRAFYYERRSGQGEYYDENGRAVHGGWLRSPLRYDRISSGFNPRRMHPILKRIVPHNGVDYAAGTGAPVWAAADGTVTWAGPKGANGNLVAIRHADGYETFYAHLHRIQRGIVRGAEVRQRQPIGAVGSTGRSTGPHLHFGLKHNGRFADPLPVIHGPGRVLASAHLGPFRRRMRHLQTELERITIGATSDAAPTPTIEVTPAPEPEEVLD